jgi:hypothetical protein
MEEACSSKTLVTTYHTTMSENRNPQWKTTFPFKLLHHSYSYVMKYVMMMMMMIGGRGEERRRRRRRRRTRRRRRRRTRTRRRRRRGTLSDNYNT